MRLCAGHNINSMLCIHIWKESGADVLAGYYRYMSGVYLYCYVKWLRLLEPSTKFDVNVHNFAASLYRIPYLSNCGIYSSWGCQVPSMCILFYSMPYNSFWLVCFHGTLINGLRQKWKSAAIIVVFWNWTWWSKSMVWMNYLLHCSKIKFFSFCLYGSGSIGVQAIQVVSVEGM